MSENHKDKLKNIFYDYSPPQAGKNTILHFKTSIFLAKITISALFPNSNPEKNPACGRILGLYPPPLVREKGKTRGGYNLRIWVDQYTVS